MKNILEYKYFNSLNEQVMLLGSAGTASRFNLSKGSNTSNKSGKTPGSETDTGDSSSVIPRRATSEEKLKETFKKARLLKKISNPASKNIAKNLNNLMKGFGGNSKVMEILRKVKNLDELSSIISSYKEIYKTNLYSDISREWNLSWDSLWNSVSRLNPSVSQYISNTAST